MTTTFTIDDLIGIMGDSVGVDDGIRLDGEAAEVPFADHGYDSLALLELAGQLKRRLGLNFSDDEALENLTSPARAVEFVQARLAAKVA